MKTVPKGKAPALDAVETRLKKAEAAARAAQEKLQQARVSREQKKAKAESLERELEQAEAQEKEARTLAGRRPGRAGEGGLQGRRRRLHPRKSHPEGAPGPRRREEGQGRDGSEAEGDRAEASQARRRSRRRRRPARRPPGPPPGAREEGRRSRQGPGGGSVRPGQAGGTRRLDASSSRRPSEETKPTSSNPRGSERQRDATAAQSKVATLTHEVQATEKALVRAAELVEKRATLDKEVRPRQDPGRPPQGPRAHRLDPGRSPRPPRRRRLPAPRQALPEPLRPAPRLRHGRDRRPRRAGLLRRRRLERRQHPLGPHALRRRDLPRLPGPRPGPRREPHRARRRIPRHATPWRASSSTKASAPWTPTPSTSVVGALDALHGGDRMVGIVTHVRELAERLPARLEVRPPGRDRHRPGAVAALTMPTTRCPTGLASGGPVDALVRIEREHESRRVRSVFAREAASDQGPVGEGPREATRLGRTPSGPVLTGAGGRTGHAVRDPAVRSGT